jgi:hypothetical protein
MTPRQLTTLLVLVMLFLGPLFAARFFYTHSSWLPAHTLNHGQLIEPPLSMTSLNLRDVSKGQWLLLYFEPETCAQHCADVLYKMRQVREALGKNSDHLKRVMIVFSKQPKLNQWLATDFAGTELRIIDKKQWQLFWDARPMVNANSSALFIVDVAGNFMMHYPLNIPPRDLYNDITRLFRAAQVE